MKKTTKFLWKPGEFKISPCLDCKHWIANGVCTAFMEGVPDSILLGDNDHRQPYPGDNGIQYEPIREQDAAVVNQGA